MTMSTNNTRQISDLALAAALSLWLPVIDINKTNPRRAEFLFEETDQLQELTEKYWQGKMTVSPLEYHGALKSLKARLYAETP